MSLSLQDAAHLFNCCLAEARVAFLLIRLPASRTLAQAMRLEDKAPGFSRHID